jgi:hypothetical protein
MILTIAQLQQRRALIRHAAAKADRTALRQRVAAPAAAPAAGLGGSPDLAAIIEAEHWTIEDLELALYKFLAAP